VTENNCPQAEHNQVDASGESRMDSSRLRPTGGAVTLEMRPGGEEDVSVIRQLFPNAEERIEVIGHRLGADQTVVEVRLPVFRCIYPTMPAAHEACRSLPETVGTHLEAVTVLHEAEFEALADYHSRQLLIVDYLLRDKTCAHADVRDYLYHNDRLNTLASILGEERVVPSSIDLKRLLTHAPS
jgi:hypothetical protein